MKIEYKTKSTSSVSAIVDDIELNLTVSTRRIIRPTIIHNTADHNASIKIDILHQRAIQKGEFEDISAEKLTQYKAKEIGKLSLDSEQTKMLFTHLCNLYAIFDENGVPLGDKTFNFDEDRKNIQIGSKRASVIKELIQQGHSNEVWNELVENSPDLATKLSIAHIYHTRMTALQTFEAMLLCEHSENDWQNFFEDNTWIFGYGLDYKILKNVTEQPTYGGATYKGDGTNKGDFLAATQGYLGFTVLVEIKKSNTQLLSRKKYRNDVLLPSEDLIGGVSQLRINARTWEHEGSQSPKNRDLLEGNSIFTVQPRKILIIGNTEQLRDREMRENFELFRKGQNEVEILTFDEVYQRAKYIIDHSSE